MLACPDSLVSNSLSGDNVKEIFIKKKLWFTLNSHWKYLPEIAERVKNLDGNFRFRIGLGKK